MNRVAFLVTCVLSVCVTAAPLGSAAKPESVPGELIVKLRGSARPGDLPALRHATVIPLFSKLPEAAAVLERFPRRTARIPLTERARAQASLERLRNVYLVRVG